MWIMIAGPYRSNAADEAARRANLAALNEAAYAVFRKGHVPIIGVNLALPIIEAAEAGVANAGGGDVYDEVMMPLSLAAAERCDAVLRVGGASAGADQEVERIRAAGGRVFTSIDDVPVRSET